LKRQDHTSGPIITSILRMGVPSLIGFGLGNIYDLIDMYWLSRIGAAPVAAVTILGPLLWVMHAANHIVGAGSVAIISRRYGEQDYLRTELAIRETIILKWLAAVSIGLLGYLLVPWIISMLGAPADIAPLSITYGRIIFLGLGFNFATYSVFTALRGISNPNKAMMLMISMNLINIILDRIMILGWWIVPPLGVAGAAWASVLAYTITFIAGMVILTRGQAHIRLRLRSGAPLDWGIMRQILRIGAPSGIGSVSFSLARLVIMPLITVFGTGVVAAYGVGTRISAFGFMLVFGIGLGLSALIGQSMGAGKVERARKTAYTAIVLGTGIMTLLGIGAFFGARFIMERFFTDQAIIDYGIVMLRIFALGFPFIGFHIMIENVYGGVGENRPPMFASLCHAWLLEVPAVYLCVKLFHLDQTAVWIAITGAGVISSIGFFIYFRRGQWLKARV
jgi:MATE family, multidrug efflux pump